MPVNHGSRYEFAPVEQDAAGRTFLDVPVPPSKSTLLRGAARVIAAQGDTLWTLAWRRYKDTLDPERRVRPTSFFDVIAHANDIVDAFAPIEPGTVIFLPSIEVVTGEVRVAPTFYRKNTVT